MFQLLHGLPESASAFQGSETPADYFCKTAGMSRQNSSQIQMTATRQKGIYEIQKQKINQTAYRAEVTNASACHEFRAVVS